MARAEYRQYKIRDRAALPGREYMLSGFRSVEDEWSDGGKKTLFIPSVLARFLKNIRVAGEPRNFFPLNNQKGAVACLSVCGMDPVLVMWSGKYLNVTNGGWCVIIEMDKPIESILYKPVADSDKDASDLCKILFGLFAYIQAFGDVVIPGFPEDMMERCKRYSRNNGETPTTVRLVDEVRNTPSAHWRNCCFKTLRADRYKRNPDGTCRVVFQRACIVGKVSPFRVVEHA